MNNKHFSFPILLSLSSLSLLLIDHNWYWRAYEYVAVCKMLNVPFFTRSTLRFVALPLSASVWKGITQCTGDDSVLV